MPALRVGRVIPKAKINGLLSALERDHVVRFNNGSQVEYEDCAKCAGEGVLPSVLRHSATIVDERPCDRCGGEKVRLLVTRPAGGVARYRLDTELRSAYAMALWGPTPKQQPSGDPAMFGDDPPW